MRLTVQSLWMNSRKVDVYETADIQDARAAEECYGYNLFAVVLMVLLSDRRCHCETSRSAIGAVVSGRQ